MAIPTAKTLEKGIINTKNHETGVRENREETDAELAERQAGYDSWLASYYINKTQEIEQLGIGQLPHTDWTQLLDSNLTEESVAEFAAYRKQLKELSKDLLKGDSTPTDPNANVWDVDFPIHTLLPTEPTPVYKPEE
tara:strand:+ start:144 stop:554 length:411 start_codon:yes stop_codon:yes gene_type:complete